MRDGLPSMKTATIPLEAALERLEVGVASVGPEEVPSHGEWGVIRLGAVTSGQFDSAKAKRLPPSVVPRPALEIRQGDVLVVRVNGARKLVGSVCMVGSVRPRLMLSDLVMRLVPARHIMDPRFLSIALSAPSVRHQILSRLRGTSGQFQLPQSEIKSVLVPCPPLAEQRRIVEVVDAVSAQEHAIEASIVKLRDVRQGALLAAMASIGNGEPLPGWVRAPLKDLVPEAEYGISEALDKNPQGVPVLRMNNLANGRPELSDLKYSPVPAPARLELRYGDVLFNRTNSIDHIGKSGMWRDELPRAAFASYLVRINPDAARLIPEYLVEWLMHPVIRQRVRSISTVAIQQVNVNPTRLRELEIDMPIDPAEQRRIVASLYSCDEQIEGEQVELSKLRAVKQGLVDDLLG